MWPSTIGREVLGRYVLIDRVLNCVYLLLVVAHEVVVCGWQRNVLLQEAVLADEPLLPTQLREWAETVTAEAGSRHFGV